MRDGLQQGAGWLAAGAALGLGIGRAVQEAFTPPEEIDLRGQVALVTGGSRGLGLAMSRELAREGCRLVICARDTSELAFARADLERRGAEVMAIPCDVADREQVGSMVEAAERRFGQVDILINNAGIIVVAPMEAMTYDDFQRVMAINFWGVVNATLAVLPGMRARRAGRIVNITSIGGKLAMPHMLPYTFAKFAAVGLSAGLRAELADAGIVVTTVVPGLMRTGSYLHAEFSGEREGEYRWFALASSAPFPVTTSPEQAAKIIVQAVRRGQAECTFPFTATLASRVSGLFPGATANVLSLVDRLLPSAPPQSVPPLRGATVESGLDAPFFEAMTALGRAGAEKHNQLAAPVPPPPGMPDDIVR